MRGQCHAPAALYLGKDPVLIVQEAGWAPGPVWKDAENLAPTGIRSPDRPARSQSLYRLRYPVYTGGCSITDNDEDAILHNDYNIQCNSLVSETVIDNLSLRRLMSYIYMEHPFLMFLDHTQRRSTVGRTPLDE